MPKKDIILNLPGYSISKVTGNNPIYIHVTYNRVVRCIHCNGKRLRKKDSFERKIRHESIGLRYSYVCIKAHKFRCYDCKRYFNQRFPGGGKYQRATESLRKEVFHHHTQGVSQKDLSRHFHTGKSTIERWYHYGYKRQQPAIGAIYDFKQELHQLLTKKHCTAKECKRLLPRFLEMVEELKQSAFNILEH